MPNGAPTVQKLVAFQRRQMLRHLRRLSPQDRRLRFGTYINDDAIERYVMDIDFARDKVFGIFEPDLTLAGVAHLALEPARGTAELGLSVDAAHRGKGYGYALLNHGRLCAQNLGCRRLYMHCLAENHIMMHLARKAGMQVVTDCGEADAYVVLGETAREKPAREFPGDPGVLPDSPLGRQARWFPAFRR
ncbi:MAG: GNAT family N-acetyltransferase [Burkholderiales bacterium]